MRIERVIPHRTFSVAICLFLFAITTSAQNVSKSWLELPRNEAEKLLADSPWSHTQIDTDASEMFYSPTKQGAATPGRSSVGTNTSNQQSINNNRADRGAVNQTVTVSYRISFLSARPVRQAFAKMILSSQHDNNPELVKGLQDFVDRDFSAYIVIAVSVESNDQRFLGPIMQQINTAAAGTLKNSAYLERPDGKRLFLSSYIPPIQDQDGLGAKFIFPRLVDGQPFIDANTESVRFVAEFNQGFKLNMRYKVADMMLDKKLEY